MRARRRTEATGEVAPTGRVLGIDLGARRIGVAVTDTEQLVATGVATVQRHADPADDHSRLAALVADYGAVGVVVGLPRSLAGGLGPAARGVLGELPGLRRALGVAIDTFDERLTTVAASAALRAGGRRGREQREVVDQTAAAVLLQHWADRRRGAQ